MADLKKARLAFMEMVEDLDPSVECIIPPKPAQGTYTIELVRGEDKQVLKVSEKDLLALEDEGVRQRIEERVIAAIEKLPEAFEREEDGEEGDFEEGDIDEDDIDEDEEDFEEEIEEEEEEEEGP